MKVRFQYSGQLAAIVGASEETVEFAEGTTLRETLAAMASDGRDEAFGTLLLTAENGIQPTLLLVVDGEQKTGNKDGFVPDDGATVFLMTPIAGG